MLPRAPSPRPARRTALIAAAALVLTGLAGSSSAAPGMTPPDKDPFYRYVGRTPLSAIAPGTPLRERDVTLGAFTNGTPLAATQILYRTTDTAGRPAVSVTTAVLPVTGTTAPRVVAYLSFYDAFTSRCDPSFTLRGGDPGAANQQQAEAEQGVVLALHAQGYTVTVPDFENETLDFMSGPASGRSSLDATTATLTALTLPPTTPVGMMGYSGGSVAADWASELAPRYRPQLHVVGVALGGVPVDLGRILRYVDGTPKWSSIMPALLIGATRSAQHDLTPYLSPYGAKVVRADRQRCIGEFVGNLTLKQLLKPQYADVFHVPELRTALDALTMGRGRPAEPLLIVAGNLDGTGDGVTLASDMQALAQRYCRQGVPVDYEEVPHGEHTQVGIAFMPRAFAFLAGRFAGAPPTSTC